MISSVASVCSVVRQQFPEHRWGKPHPTAYGLPPRNYPENFCGIWAFCVNRRASRNVFLWLNDLISEISRSPRGPGRQDLLARGRREGQDRNHFGPCVPAPLREIYFFGLY